MLEGFDLKFQLLLKLMSNLCSAHMKELVYVQFMPSFKPKQGMGSNVTVLAAEQHELNYPNREGGVHKHE